MDSNELGGPAQGSGTKGGEHYMSRRGLLRPGAVAGAAAAATAGSVAAAGSASAAPASAAGGSSRRTSPARDLVLPNGRIPTMDGPGRHSPTTPRGPRAHRVPVPRRRHRDLVQ